MRKNTKNILLISILGLIVLTILFWFFSLSPQAQYIAKNCPKYDFNPGFVDSTTLVDCKNYIGIEKYNDEKTLVVFNGLFLKLRNWDSFRINAYKISGDYIYFIEDPSIKNGPSYYSFTEWPDATTTPSLFRIIDTQTSEIKIYRNLEDAPSDAQTIFKQLGNGDKSNGYTSN